MRPCRHQDDPGQGTRASCHGPVGLGLGEPGLPGVPGFTGVGPASEMGDRGIGFGAPYPESTAPWANALEPRSHALRASRATNAPATVAALICLMLPPSSEILGRP